MPLPLGFVPPCLPTKAPQPPTGDTWLHEIKHDGFRVMARKDGDRVRLYSRPGKRPHLPLLADRRGAASPARALLRRRRGGMLRRRRQAELRPHLLPAAAALGTSALGAGGF